MPLRTVVTVPITPSTPVYVAVTAARTVGRPPGPPILGESLGTTGRARLPRRRRGRRRFPYNLRSIVGRRLGPAHLARSTLSTRLARLAAARQRYKRRPVGNVLM